MTEGRGTRSVVSRACEQNLYEDGCGNLGSQVSRVDYLQGCLQSITSVLRRLFFQDPPCEVAPTANADTPSIIENAEAQTACPNLMRQCLFHPYETGKQLSTTSPDTINLRAAIIVP